MLASGVSQYLHPDYLQPLPTTLDAKKSPLALLAQTCSSIGKDPTPSKPIIPPLDKKDKEASEKAEESVKRPSSRGSKSNGESGRDSKPGFRTIPPKDIPPLVPIASGSDKGSSASNNDGCSAGSSGGKSNGDSGSHSLLSASSSHSILSSSNSSITSSSIRPVSVSGSNQRSSSRSGSARDGTTDYSDTPGSSVSGTRHSASASPPSSVISKHTAPPAHSSLPSLPKPSVAHPSLLPGLSSAHPLAAYPHLSLMPGLALDPAVQSYHNALAAHSSFTSLSAAAAAAAAAQSSVLKAGAGSALSPYVAYARVRTPSGATTLVPVCRDPYCTNCQLTLQNSHLSSTCNAPGCSQCAHEKSLMSLTSGGLSGLGSASILSPISSASLSGSVTGLSSLHSLYPLAAHQGLPFVCSWMVGNEYCGKRFTSSDELLQHLRTHTSGVEASSLTASYGVLGLHPSLATAAGCHSHYTGSPLSPNSLRRSYPTSLSPVSSLLSASRYHPYKSPLGVVPPPAPTSQTLPMGPYYSPYSLYSQRLGAAAVP